MQEPGYKRKRHVGKGALAWPMKLRRGKPNLLYLRNSGFVTDVYCTSLPHIALSTQAVDKDRANLAMGQIAASRPKSLPRVSKHSFNWGGPRQKTPHCRHMTVVPSAWLPKCTRHPSSFVQPRKTRATLDCHRIKCV